MTQTAPRYALYYAPAPDDPLWQFGSSLIGYDAAARQDIPLAVPAGWTRDAWHDATQDPRRYGFHATLKAPMRLAPGMDEGALLEAVAAFAASRPAVPLEGLVMSPIGRFVALVPVAPSAALQQLATAIVERFEPFRAPLTDAEMAKRLSAGLSAQEEEYLRRYGYPYVLERFRFHMTLSGPVGDRAPDLAPVLQRTFENALRPGPARVDRIAVFRQDAPTSRFTILRSMVLRG